MLSFKFILSSALTALAIAAPNALAADLYVAKSGDDDHTCGDADPCKTVQTAVLRAGAGDTVHIGPGTFTESVVADKRVKLVGSGAGGAIFSPQNHTKIVAPAQYPAIAMTGGGEVRDLRAAGGEGAILSPAIELEAPAGAASTYLVRDVHATGGVDSTGDHVGTPALGAAGLDGGRMTLTVEASAFHQAEEWYTERPAVDLVDVGTVTIRDSEITPDERDVPLDTPPAISAGGDTTLTVEDVRTLGPTGGGLRLLHVPKATVRRSVFQAAGTALSVRSSTNTPTAVTIRDSVLLAHGEGSGPVAATVVAEQGGHADVDLVGTTIATSAKTPVAALNVTSNGTAVADVDLRGSVAHAAAGSGVAPDVFGHEGTSSTTTITQTRSAYSRVYREGDPAVATATVTANPMFASLGTGDLHLLQQSPLIDAGVDELPATDVEGRSRGADSNGDCLARSEIGAYERPAVAPPGPCPEPQQDPGTTPGAGAAGAPAPPAAGQLPAVQLPAVQRSVLDRLAPAVKGLKLSGRFATFTLGEAAKVTVTIERRKGKRWVRVARTSGRALAAGRRSLKLRRLGKGAHRITVLAVDAAGNRTTKTIRVTKKG